MIVDSKGGTFVLTAQKGKSLNYQEAVAIIADQAKPKWVELTVVGSATRVEGQLAFKGRVTGELFLLADDPDAKSSKKSTPFQKLQKALDDDAKVVAVTGRVQEQKAETAEKKPEKKAEKKPPPTLIVTGFEREDAE